MFNVYKMNNVDTIYMKIICFRHVFATKLSFFIELLFALRESELQ